MAPTRRDFLRQCTLLACGTTIPTFLARSAAALDTKATKDRILVVIQLDGGNDGLNTVVPYADDAYRQHRPTLQVAKDQVRKLDDRMGLHPSLAGFGQLLDQGRLAVVQSVGYPNPNRSHFESMSIWHTARLQATPDTPGWLTRYLDQRPLRPGADAAALHVGSDGMPQALFGSQRPVPSLTSLEQFRRRLGLPEGPAAVAQRAALDRIAGQPRGDADSLLQFVQRSAVLSYASSARLEHLNGSRDPSSRYPAFGLGERLRLIAQLIKSGLTTCLYYAHHGNFDTHARQLNSHPFLLRELGDSLRAFLEDMDRAGDGERVLVLVFSEFGRRLRENASGGTDHGTAAPVFLLGRAVRPGLHGPCPNLQDLDATGDPKHALDFRRVYATVLDQWLGCASATVLGEGFSHLPLLRG